MHVWCKTNLSLKVVQKSVIWMKIRWDAGSNCWLVSGRKDTQLLALIAPEDQGSSQVHLKNKMQLETADFAPGAATWRFWPNNVVWRLTGAITWPAGWNIRFVFDCGLFSPLYENVTLSTKPEVPNLLHCRHRRTEPRPQVTCTEDFMKFGRGFWDMRMDRQTDRQTHWSQYFAPLLGMK